MLKGDCSKCPISEMCEEVKQVVNREGNIRREGDIRLDCPILDVVGGLVSKLIGVMSAVELWEKLERKQK